MTEAELEKVSGGAKDPEWKPNDNVWDMPESGRVINGRMYSKHALERMAPDTPQVRAELEKRALASGFARGTKKFNDYVQPRNIPPTVVEDTINNGIKIGGDSIGTLKYTTSDLEVIINSEGKVVSVWPK